MHLYESILLHFYEVHKLSKSLSIGKSLGNGEKSKVALRKTLTLRIKISEGTFNECSRQTFFGYVNRKKVCEAKRKVKFRRKPGLKLHTCSRATLPTHLVK